MHDYAFGWIKHSLRGGNKEWCFSNIWWSQPCTGHSTCPPIIGPI